MTGTPDLFAGPEGSTPLGPDEMTGLIPTWIATRGDLDMAERDNITTAMVWAFNQRWAANTLLDRETMHGLHRRMFCDVWAWAGSPRLRETTIGADPRHISVLLRDLLDDVRMQVADPTCSWGADEVAVRFHHRLVSIHPFPNGNGRHARLAADLLVVMMDRPRFTWGNESLTRAGEARSTYLDALRTADATREYAPLVNFARS